MIDYFKNKQLSVCGPAALLTASRIVPPRGCELPMTDNDPFAGLPVVPAFALTSKDRHRRNAG